MENTKHSGERIIRSLTAAARRTCIVYKDTTYLPMRKIAEMNGKAIYWNGDSNTAAMTAPQRENSQKVLAEKPDSYGNVWTYYTFTAEDDTSYLGIKDERRGYERVYRIAEGEADNIGVTENEIYFFPKCGARRRRRNISVQNCVFE